MASAGGLLRDALNRLIVRSGGLDVPLPAGTTWADLLERYGSSSAVADAVGYRRAAPYSPAWKARRNLLRNFQGERLRRHISPELRQRLRRGVAPGPRTRREVLNIINDQGVIVLGFAGWVRVSQDLRYRTVPNVFIPAELLYENGFFPPAYANDWTAAAEAFGNAWGIAYGIGYVDLEEMDTLDLALPGGTT